MEGGSILVAIWALPTDRKPEGGEVRGTGCWAISTYLSPIACFRGCRGRFHPIFPQDYLSDWPYYLLCKNISIFSPATTSSILKYHPVDVCVLLTFDVMAPNKESSSLISQRVVSGPSSSWGLVASGDQRNLRCCDKCGGHPCTMRVKCKTPCLFTLNTVEQCTMQGAETVLKWMASASLSSSYLPLLMPLMMPASFLQATNPHNHYLHRAYCVHPVEST